MAAISFLSAAPSSSFHGGLHLGKSDPCLFGSYPQTGNTQKASLSIRCQSTNTKESKSSNILDNASNLFTNLLSGGSLGSMPTAEGAVSDLFGKPLFLSLYDWFMEGVLAEILEPIMGKGLIPADLDTWKLRRRAITPAFHALYLEAMVKIFSDCSEKMILKSEKLLKEKEVSSGEGDTIELDLEAEFSSLALDIIGLSVFNYDFGSVTKESPVIKAVYGTLFEAEHRSTFYFPYWNFPPARWIVPRQRKFQSDLKIINDCLDGLIQNAKETRQETDVEKLQQRDYSNLKDASLLRFLLRDDLMTMLIAGHETTAAVLTWAVYLLAQSPAKIRKAQAEIDAVLGEGAPTYESLKKLEYIRLIVVESLRLYPQPPLLIRRTLKPETLPGGYKGEKEGHKVPKGTDIFISVYNLHRSPYFWDNPQEFEPERFLRTKESNGIEGWAGFDPSRSPGALYPNEIIADFAFLPFGGGPRKCIGDQFALMESTVALAMLLQKFDVELRGPPESVELVSGATIHAKNGMWCKLKRRSK
ncbi:hypothetical protein DY000_02053824 [Brassica cretica]|uniref:Cytochrome P450 n=1 Tax=Brassica cretica TaxID=69181 RepID=A0ABQ7ABN6_BRACR|nr:hypothetical protein DY000_02053824 [Brassica cretica]